MVFSDTVNKTGILEQVRAMMRVDATQYPTSRVVNSVNNYLDTVTGYAIGNDRNFQWDDTNHTALPIGTTNLVISQSDYSFLTDQQGNAILGLTRIDILDTDGKYRELQLIDQTNITGALDEFESTAGKALYYDKIADNIIRLYPKPSANVTNGLKFHFQRVGSYFTATDTTKQPGVAPLLHRGFVIASAYDGALTLGLANTNVLAVEMQREEAKMKLYFSARNQDVAKRLNIAVENNR